LATFAKPGSEPALSQRQRTLVINDAKEESQSAATKYADRSRPIIRQSSREPNDTALPGNGKPVAVPAACPRTSLTADRCADLLLASALEQFAARRPTFPRVWAIQAEHASQHAFLPSGFSAARQEAKASVLFLGENT